MISYKNYLNCFHSKRQIKIRVLFLAFSLIYNHSSLFAQVISGGDDFSLFVCSDNTVWSCGNGLEGQLGLGSASCCTSIPTQIPSLSGITAVAAGYSHSLFLKNNGTVWACGGNTYGNLGVGTTIQQNTPIQISSLSGIAAIAGGYYHSLFLKNDGTVWACGNNAVGELGDGTTTQRNSPVQVNITGTVIAISAGYYHSLFLKSDGTVWVCGYNGNGQLGDGTTTQRNTPVQISSLSGITAIAGGHLHSLFLKSDGTVWACGRNNFGQLGDGTTTQRTTPVHITSLSGITAIAAGGEVSGVQGGHSLFLKNDNTVWACGAGGLGQLGDGTATDQNTPVQVNITGTVTTIECGGAHSLFLKSDGTVWAGGAGNEGQLGWGFLNNSNYSLVQVIGLCSVIPLSIELLSFEANCSNNNIFLSWKTSTERNNDFFTLQCSSNGVNFQDIAYIPGAGNSTSLLSYSYIDNITANPIIYYYRLKQTDFNGDFTYSDLIAISPCVNIDDFLIYPTVSPGIFSVSGKNTIHSPITITVYNSIGQLIFSTSSNSLPCQIDLSSFSDGLYMVQINSGSKFINQKVIIRK